mgnify:CR=1 FL=1
MTRNNNLKSILDSRPILIIANSSWYISHYRSLLLEKIAIKNKLITMAPIDGSSSKLSEKSIFIPWRIYRSNDLNLLSLILSLIKMLLLVRAIKPKLIHSHTLKTNLLSSFVSFLYGIPIVFSFAGMGRLSKSKGLKLIFLKIILNLISYFAVRQRNSRFSWGINSSKSFLIFQNPLDIKMFNKYVPNLSNKFKKLIPGSGLPMNYFEQNLLLRKNKWINDHFKDTKLNSITLIYCGRLIKSKGIYIFLEILKNNPSFKGIIFGSIDPSSDDSVKEEEIKEISKKYQNFYYAGHKVEPLLNLNEEYPIVLLPSNYGEGLSRTILESLSLKIPLICSKKALSGIFNNNQLYYVNKNAPEEYYQKILLIIENYKKNLLIKKLNNGYDYVKEKFSENDIVTNTLSLYSELLNNNNSSYLTKNNKNESFWLAQ